LLLTVIVFFGLTLMIVALQAKKLPPIFSFVEPVAWVQLRISNRQPLPYSSYSGLHLPAGFDLHGN